MARRNREALSVVDRAGEIAETVKFPCTIHDVKHYGGAVISVCCQVKRNRAVYWL
jgi:hypothetical protein